MTVELSERVKENLQRNAESRKRDSKFVKLESGEKTTLHFDPKKIEPVEVFADAGGPRKDEKTKNKKL
jgi:hypothetical protein